MTKNILKCFIVESDDDKKFNLINFVNGHPNLSLVQSSKETEAIKIHLQNDCIDLIFISLDLDSCDAFSFLDSLGDKPAIIFTSSQTSQAFKAFDYNAVDFLKMPVKKDRFLYAIEKAILQSRFDQEPEPDPGDFIFVKSKLKKRKVYLNTLKYIQALGDYVKIITTEDNHVVLSTMKSFEFSLPQDRFQRIHKSYIVNIEMIQRYNSTAVEIDGEVLPLSRNRKPTLIGILKEKEKQALLSK